MTEVMAVEKKSQSRLFVPSLAISASAVVITNLLVTLLLVEIASTFQVSEGVAVQLRTVNAVAEVIFGVLMGFLAVRFRHKSLLLVGVTLVALSALGSFFAPTLSLLLLFSFFEGSGSIMVTIMVFTLIGDSLPLNKKTRAVSWVLAAGYVFSLWGNPMISFFADIGGWRYVFLMLVLPVSAIGIISAFFGVSSSKLDRKPPAIDRWTYLHNFKQVFLNKSAASCLIGGLLFTGASFGVFAIAFYRNVFLVSREVTVYILVIIGLIAIIGSLVGGRLAGRFSVKSLTAINVFGCGVSIVLLFFSPNIWTALVFNFSCTWFIAVGTSAFCCLVLEQVPTCRGTMMSLYRLFSGIGLIVAPAIGGGILVLFSSWSKEIGYQALGLGIGGMSIAAACIIFFLAKDINRDNASESKSLGVTQGE